MIEGSKATWNNICKNVGHFIPGIRERAKELTNSGDIFRHFIDNEIVGAIVMQTIQKI